MRVVHVCGDIILHIRDGVDQPGWIVSQRRDVVQGILDGQQLPLGVIRECRHAGSRVTVRRRRGDREQISIPVVGVRRDFAQRISSGENFAEAVVRVLRRSSNARGDGDRDRGHVPVGIVGVARDVAVLVRLG